MNAIIYYGHNDYRDYLAHHGILGQRWGKRNGPPYPLGVGDHSASEKRAGWKNSLSKEEKHQKKRDKYVQKEIKKVDKYYDKKEEKYDRELQRNEEQIDKALKNTVFTTREKYEQKSSRADRFIEKKSRIINEMTMSEGERQVQKSALKHYSYEDVKREKRHIAAVGAMAVTENLLNIPLRALGSPVMFISTPNIHAIKRNYRAKYERKRQENEGD